MAPAFSISYILENDPRIQERVRRRFSKDIAFLKANGFRELCFYGEQMPPLTLRRVRYLPIIVLMVFGREVIHVSDQRQVTASFALLVHLERATIAVPMGMGTKLYTAFEDGSLLITNSFPVWEPPRAGTNVEKQSSAGRGIDAWTFHQARLAELEREGKTRDHCLDFGAYVRMSNQEEQSIG